MTQEETTYFAKLLVQQIRDTAIKNCDDQLYATNLKSPVANRWRQAEEEMDMKEFGKMIIADAVDETISYFLDAIDNRVLNVSYNLPNGKTINVSGEIIGELLGWYIGDWRFKYSKERCIDDFPDL